MAFSATPIGRLYWRQDGASSRPALVLLHPALCDHTVWDRMLPFLADHFRVIRIDMPGHGASELRRDEPTIADLADAIFAVLDAAEVNRALVCGLSLGGMTALKMAAADPQRICGIVAALGPVDFRSDLWKQRSARASDVVVSEIVDRFFDTAFSVQEQKRLAMWLDPLRRAMLSTSGDGYRKLAACHADADISRLANECKVPGTIVLTGNQAVAPQWQDHASLLVALSAAGSLPSIEAPGEFAGILARLYDRIQPDGAGMDPSRNGERVRREVLGDPWVDRSLAARDEWIADYQDYATQVAWHTIWGRKGLDYRTRRLLVLATTAALGRWEEFRFHVRLGIERGSLTVQDVKEVSLQTGLYAGVPVSNTAFNEARAILTELGISFRLD